MQNRDLAHILYSKATIFCTGLDDSIIIRWEVCRLPEYAARLKLVIPDYNWVIFGVGVWSEDVRMQIIPAETISGTFTGMFWENRF
ncbi:hypothetical protein N4G41_00695 [Kosakonia sacchari]|uniref:hypothetical protein n=1 Tax=Kosakonia sacchari TaxID=1158459 RepID=UPI002ACE5395|nr:hypothetical protein [Kosakonia sacchari]MDZ7320152.1 hypothetical protein [Kosakonia sacchari]